MFGSIDAGDFKHVKDRLETLERRAEQLQRDLDRVDLHARAIVEEAKRLIAKFERRLDREAKPDDDASKSRQEPLGPTIPRAAHIQRPPQGKIPNYGG
jgi:hypothetical protein